MLTRSAKEKLRSEFHNRESLDSATVDAKIAELVLKGTFEEVGEGEEAVIYKYLPESGVQKRRFAVRVTKAGIGVGLNGEGQIG